MYRSLSYFRELLPNSWSLLVRGVSTCSPSMGGIQMTLQKKSRLLDTSRDVEGEEKTEVNQVTLSKDGRIVVCWHPEQLFPYELTKPIPIETIPTDSHLKVQAIAPVKEIFRKKHKRLIVQELMELTNTPKYTWFNWKKKRQVRYQKLNPLNTQRDREYL